jgi:hypothetical protein
MTTALKEIVGELSGLSGERQQVAASVIHVLWAEEQSADAIHPEWQGELDRRNAQIESGEVGLADEASMETFVDKLLADEA